MAAPVLEELCGNVKGKAKLSSLIHFEMIFVQHERQDLQSYVHEEEILFHLLLNSPHLDYRTCKGHSNF